jgi:hypothetical protein
MKLAHKHIKNILILLTFLASIKMLLQNFSLDEEYQVLMSYRHIMGDEMIATMWEPHQTSSFLCTLLSWPYYLITGTFTGIVIYLRLAGTLIHLGISVYFYKILKHFLDKEQSFYLSLIFFNTIPKLIMLPEFGGMQVWFGVLCFLLIIDSVEDITPILGSYGKLILAALCLCLEVLSYPSCALLFIPFIGMIWYFHTQKRLAKCILFSGTCMLVGGAYVGYFILRLGIHDFLRNVDALLSSDLTHTFDSTSKLTVLGECLLQYAIIFIALTVLAWILSLIPFVKKVLPGPNGFSIVMLTILLANLYQLFLWVILNKGYEYLNIHLAVTLCLGLWLMIFKLSAKYSFSCSIRAILSSLSRRLSISFSRRSISFLNSKSRTCFAI